MLRCYDFGQFPDKFFVIFDFTQSAAGNGNTVLFTGQDSSLAYEDFSKSDKSVLFHYNTLRYLLTIKHCRQ